MCQVPSALLALGGDWDVGKSILLASGWAPGWSRLCSLQSGQNPSLLQEINSQKHKAGGAGLSEVSESAVCLHQCQAKGKLGCREQKGQAGFL